MSTANRATDVLVFPMSYGQEQVWYLHEIDPTSSAYNIPFAFRIRGPLHVRALADAIRETVLRHEALRTNFGTIDGEPRQIVSLDPRFEMRTVRLEPLAARSVDEQVRRAAQEEATLPFDLRREWPIRARLLSFDEQEHVLLLNFHHIAVDHLSVLRVSRDIAQAYESAVGGTPQALENRAAGLQFSDFALWQREQLQGERLARRLGHWAKKFEGFSGVLKLPTDRPRPALQTFRGAEIEFDIPAEIASGAKDLSRRSGVSLFICLLTVAQILLHRYAGQSDIVVGCPFANRTQEELGDVAGLFMNPLPICTRIAPDETFRSLIAKVKEEVFSAQEHQETPFEKIVQAVDHPRDPSYNPLLQVLFTLQDPPMTLRLPDVTVESLGVHNGGAKLDLSFWLWEQGQEIRGLLEYNSDLFDRSSAERMARHLVTLLRAVVAMPDLAISKLPLLDAAERRHIVQSFNDTRRSYEAGVCLHELIERQTDARREQAAVIFDGASLSYAELDRAANRVAHYLLDQGVGRDELVAVCAERSPELVVGLLGVLKAGAAYVPLDPEYPEERLRYMLQDSAAKVVLTQERLLERLPAGQARALCLDRDQPILDRYPSERPRAAARPEDLAYVIYTSGSTGRPKGAMNEHRAIVNRLHWMQETFQLASGDAVLQKTPSSFDVSVWEFFWALLAGARLVLARPGGHQDPGYLAQLIERERISVVHFVPSMLHAFLDVPDLRERCRSLRYVISSGEALPPELQERLFSLLDAELHNLYGPTEAAVDVTHWRCVRDGGDGVVPIGRPIANTQVYILDPHLEPVPVGVAGELHIGGVQVGRGYWRRPELTAERFISDSFGAEGRGSLYKSGDFARFRADGVIEYLGRLDDQVKVRGLRIELKEVEAALESHPSVRRAAARVFQARSGDQRMVAYVVPSQGGFAAADLRKHLRSVLPGYMVPQQFLELQHLPLTPSGKLDRGALPEPLSAPPPGPSGQPPSTPMERLIAEVWQEIIGGGIAASRTDNFFELGGHSLLAIRAIVRIEEQTGWRPSMRQLILENLQEIASHCEDAVRQPTNASLLARLRGLMRVHE